MRGLTALAFTAALLLAAVPARADRVAAGIEAYRAEDFARAAELFGVAAEAGEAEAQYRLGLMAYYGQGMTRDADAAAAWYRRAAAQDHPGALFNLSLMHSDGEGVARDPAAAARLARRAAERGDAMAQYRLAYLYARGEGVPQDDSEAAAWTRRAAEQGDPRAQYSFGFMHARGRGLARDPVEALRWLALAIEGFAPGEGRQRAMQLYEAVAEPLPDYLRIEAARRAAAWRPRIETAAAEAASAPGFQIQLAALPSPEAAEAAWRGLQAAHRDLLGALEPEILRAELGERGVFYRLRAGPLADRAAARALCAALDAHATPCLVVGR